MRKRVEVTQIMSQDEIHERDLTIKNIQHLGREIASGITKHEDLLPSVAYRVSDVYSEETYQRRRFLRRPVTETRTKQESLTLILMMSNPHVWLTMDGRFTQRRQQNKMYVINLNDLHITTLQTLEKQMRTHHLNLFPK